jgi:hypothetical protein
MMLVSVGRSAVHSRAPAAVRGRRVWEAAGAECAVVAGQFPIQRQVGGDDQMDLVFGGLQDGQLACAESGDGVIQGPAGH